MNCHDIVPGDAHYIGGIASGYLTELDFQPVADCSGVVDIDSLAALA